MHFPNASWLRSFRSSWGLGVRRARTGGLTSQITEQFNAKLLKTVKTNPFYRMILRRITEKIQAKLPKTELFDYFCGSKCIDL